MRDPFNTRTDEHCMNCGVQMENMPSNSQQGHKHRGAYARARELGWARTRDANGRIRFKCTDCRRP